MTIIFRLPLLQLRNPYVDLGVPQFAPPVDAARAWLVSSNGQPLPTQSIVGPDFGALKTVANIYGEYFG